MESVLQKEGVHRNDTIFRKRGQLLAYAENIVIIGRTKRDVTAAISATERESTKIGPAINEGKAKYMLSTNRDVRRIDSQITVDNHTFNTVKEFIYLDSAVITIVSTFHKLRGINHSLNFLSKQNSPLLSDE